MADLSADKTHEPTPRRRQQAREAGRVAQSHDLGAAVLLLGSLGVLVFTGGALVEFLADLLRAQLSGGAWRSWIDSPGTGSRVVADQWGVVVPSLARLLLPVLAGAALVAVSTGMLQTGFLVRSGRVAADFSRVNPLAGLQRVFSASGSRLLFVVCKIAIVGAVGFAGLWSRREELADLAALELPQLAAQAWDVCFWACLEMGGALLALAAVDYLYERYKLERELRMTPQELRDEMRELQGNPQIAARRRQLRQKASSDRVGVVTGTTAGD